MMKAKCKNAFRFGLGRKWRLPNLIGKTEAQLRRSAGKTNIFINLYGALVAFSGASNANGCNCNEN